MSTAVQQVDNKFEYKNHQTIIWCRINTNFVSRSQTKRKAVADLEEQHGGDNWDEGKVNKISLQRIPDNFGVEQ